MKIIEKTYNWSGTLQNRPKTNYIVLHHMAGNGSVDTLHTAHLKNGWAGIGYHFFVRKDGSIYRGRPIDKTGAHISNYNSQCLGICFEGNFENEKMSSVQIKSGQELISYVLRIYPKAKIIKHKELNATACPGTNFPFEKIIEGGEPEMTLEKAIEIVKSEAGLEQQTIDFMLCYKYGEELMIKLAKAMEW